MVKTYQSKEEKGQVEKDADDDDDVKTRYYKLRKGLFGHTLSLFGVTKGHARSHLHWHFSINAGIPVTVLQRFANLQPFCNKIVEVLETIYCCDVEKQVMQYQGRVVFLFVRTVHHHTAHLEPLGRQNIWRKCGI